MAKYLVTNADDFGFTRDVNSGIVEAHQQGILTATTLMANGDAFEDALRLAELNPDLDIGCHLVLVGGRSLIGQRLWFPTSTIELTRLVYSGKIALFDELAAQVQRIVTAGIRPTHIDTHKHTHILPPVLRALCSVAQEFRIPWVRRPIDYPMPQRGAATQHLAGLVMRRMKPSITKTLAENGLKQTDHFLGFSVTGRLDERMLAEMMQHVPIGTTELMVHPGHLREELRAAPTRLKQSRELELKALTAPRVRDAMAAAGIELVNYRQLNEIYP